MTKDEILFISSRRGKSCLDLIFEIYKEIENRTCKSCKHFELDMFKDNRGICRNENTPISHSMIDCDYCCNRYEPKENK